MNRPARGVNTRIFTMDIPLILAFSFVSFFARVDAVDPATGTKLPVRPPKKVTVVSHADHSHVITEEVVPKSLPAIGPVPPINPLLPVSSVQQSLMQHPVLPLTQVSPLHPVSSLQTLNTLQTINGLQPVTTHSINPLQPFNTHVQPFNPLHPINQVSPFLPTTGRGCQNRLGSGCLHPYDECVKESRSGYLELCRPGELAFCTCHPGCLYDDTFMADGMSEVFDCKRCTCDHGQVTCKRIRFGRRCGGRRGRRRFGRGRGRGRGLMSELRDILG